MYEAAEASMFGTDRALILGRLTRIPDYIIRGVLALGLVRAPLRWETAPGGPFDASRMPSVLHKRDAECSCRACYIGKPSQFGNPFEIGRKGTRRQVIEKHLDHLAACSDTPSLAARLRGRDLVCHGHSWLLLANWPRLAQ